MGYLLSEQNSTVLNVYLAKERLTYGIQNLFKII